MDGLRVTDKGDYVECVLTSGMDGEATAGLLDDLLRLEEQKRRRGNPEPLRVLYLGQGVRNVSMGVMGTLLRRQAEFRARRMAFVGVMGGTLSFAEIVERAVRPPKLRFFSDEAEARAWLCEP